MWVKFTVQVDLNAGGCSEAEVVVNVIICLPCCSSSISSRRSGSDVVRLR